MTKLTQLLTHKYTIRFGIGFVAVAFLPVTIAVGLIYLLGTALADVMGLVDIDE